MISLTTHNVLDYVIGAFLVFAPALFGFSEVDAARNTFLTLGFALIIYSLLTQYRYSIVKWIPVGVHMALDVALGVIVMLAPWAVGYNNALTPGQTTLHFVLGIGAIVLVIATRTRASRDLRARTFDSDTETTRIDRAA